MIEIEIPGPLKNSAETSRLIRKLRRSGTKTKTYSQTVVFFKNGHDFRLKWRKNQKDFTVIFKQKTGMHFGVRKEIEMRLPKSELGGLLALLEAIGVSRAMVSQAQRTDVYAPNIIWNFSFGTVIGDFWEAEATKELKQKKKNKKQKIPKHLLQESAALGLTAWDQKTYAEIRRARWAKEKLKTIKQVARLLLLS